MRRADNKEEDEYQHGTAIMQQEIAGKRAASHSVCLGGEAENDEIDDEQAEGCRVEPVCEPGFQLLIHRKYFVFQSE